MSDQELATIIEILLTELKRRILPEPEQPKPVELLSQPENSIPLVADYVKGDVLPRDRYEKGQMILWQNPASGGQLACKIIDVIDSDRYVIFTKGWRKNRIATSAQIVGLYISR
ncbi:hypothetical protein TUMEXPCC7403_16905 [Tumidithrix helvetica PCC 7403]|uniref:hypothetical protein n=1 Tax=Tumidithrix helvetica TaxID=3457545 RepID=UPI003C870704